MKPIRQLIFASLFAVGFAGAACSGNGNGNGGNGNGGPDATPTPPGGGDDDDDDGGGGGTPTGFSAFVIDLIENQTAENTEPVTVDFDSEDGEEDSYDTLFD